MTLRIVSRGSELALWQTNAVRDALVAAEEGLAVDVVVVRTVGDRVLDVPLSRIGDRGLFTRELDGALLAGDADLAVHSLKDLPTRLPEGLVLAAVTRRADPRDVLLLPSGRRGGLESLAAGARVGTSSLRRRAQLAALRPELSVPDLRGNLNTRLAKLDGGEYEAIVLAAAGVLRLGWSARISAWLDPESWLPAVGQGALGIVVRADREDVLRRVRPLHDAPTAASTACERALLGALEGGCQVPIGALATVDGDRITLRAMVASLDGARVLRVTERGTVAAAVDVGLRAAHSLRAEGADALLADARAGNTPVDIAP